MPYIITVGYVWVTYSIAEPYFVLTNALIWGRIVQIQDATMILIVLIIKSNWKRIRIAFQSKLRLEWLHKPFLLCWDFLYEIPWTCGLLLILVTIANMAVADVSPLLIDLWHYILWRNLLELNWFWIREVNRVVRRKIARWDHFINNRSNLARSTPARPWELLDLLRRHLSFLDNQCSLLYQEFVNKLWLVALDYEVGETLIQKVQVSIMKQEWVS